MNLIQKTHDLVKKGDVFLQKFPKEDFHKYASEILSGLDLHKDYNFQDIVEHSLSPSHSQHFKNLEFSDLPVTLSRGEHCFLDVYFWRRRPTVVHNHHFVGAFMCLEGNNVDLEYTFQKERELGRFHDLGTLSLKNKRQMKPGDISEIALMDRYIHQNHHQAELTINMCFRTPQETDKSLSNYLYSGLRYEKDTDLMGKMRRLERFLFLGKVDEKKINLGLDEAIHFLIQTLGTESLNPRLLNLIKKLDHKVQSETGLDISKLFKAHDEMLKDFEMEYE